MKGYLVALFTNYLGLAVSMLIQIMLMPFLLNRMGAQMTGLYYLFMTISNFVAVGIGWLTGAGVYLLASSDATRHVSGDVSREEITLGEVHRAVLMGFTAYATLVLMIVCAGGLSAGTWWFRGADAATVKEARTACFLLGIYIWVHYIHQADISVFTATLQQGWVNFYRIVSQLIFVVCILLLVLPAPRLDLLMLSNLIGVMTAAVAARLHLRISGRLGPLEWKLPNPDLIKKMFVTKGGAYFIFGIAQFGLIYGDVLIIGAILGADMVSAYLIIWKIPEVAALLLSRISEILSPYLTRIDSRKGANRIAAVFLCTSRLQHCLGIIAGLAYGLFGSEMAALWVGEAHRPDTPWFYWTAGALLAFQVMNRHDIVLHYALAKLGNLVIVQFAELFLKVLLTMLLFKSLGIAAPLVAGLAVQLSGLTWFYRASALRQVNSRWADWFVQVAVWASLLLTVIAGGALLISRVIPKHGIANFILGISLYTCIAVMTVLLIERRQQQNGLFGLKIED